MKSGKFLFEQAFAECFLLPIIKSAGLAHAFNRYLNDFFFRYLEYSSEGDTVLAFIEFAFDIVIHGSDSNLGCNFYCNKNNSVSVFH